MGLLYLHLDQRARGLMLDELEQDVEANRLYLSRRLNPPGQEEWPHLLRDAIMSGDDDLLAAELRRGQWLMDRELCQPAGRRPYMKRVPHNAHETLAEGEFHRFYIRALCRRAIENGDDDLEIFRAKPVREPRPGSEVRLGQHVVAEQLLEDLRRNVGVETALRIPGGPNSGLSVRLLGSERASASA